jgi:serine/threonine protein kinase
VSAEHPGLGRLLPTDPESIGPYRLLGRLGEGGMGTVYLALAPTGRAVAVKVVKAEFAVVEGFAARFHAEVDNARRVASFCTAQVLDNGNDDDGRPFMVTEYIAGTPLSRQIAEHGALEAGPLHGVALGVAAALAAIHIAGLVHRDLKPANVVLSLTGPRVIDFGIARALDRTTNFTLSGELLGSPGWWAPEQVRGRDVTPAADIFAWGCLVAYAGTGRHPFGRGDALALAARVLNSTPDLGVLPAPLNELARQATSMDPQARPTAQDLVIALLGGGVVVSRQDPPPEGTPNPATLVATEFLAESWQPPTNVGPDATLALAALDPGAGTRTDTGTAAPAPSPDDEDTAPRPLVRPAPPPASEQAAAHRAGTANPEPDPAAAPTGALSAGPPVPDPVAPAPGTSPTPAGSAPGASPDGPGQARPAPVPGPATPGARVPVTPVPDTPVPGPAGLGPPAPYPFSTPPAGGSSELRENQTLPGELRPSGRRWLFALIAAATALVVTAVVLVAIVSRGGEVTIAQQPQPTVGVPPPDTDIGKRISTGSLIENPQLMIPVAPRCGLADFAGSTPTRGQFCAITWTLFNTGGDLVPVSRKPPTLVDDRNDVYEPHAASSGVPSAITPGGRADGVLVYDLPEGRTPARLIGQVLEGGKEIEVRLS